MAEKIGRYNIIKYSQAKLARMQALHRHIYALNNVNGEKVVSLYVPGITPEYLLITDKRIFLTSSVDTITFEKFKRLLFFKDSSITL